MCLIYAIVTIYFIIPSPQSIYCRIKLLSLVKVCSEFVEIVPQICIVLYFVYKINISN